MKVDTEWFKDLIRRSPYGSQRRLAKKFRGRNSQPLDQSALSLMLRGKRAIQLHEAKQFADLLDVPLIEVLRHAGVAQAEEGARTVPLAGTINSAGELRMFSGKEREVVSGPGELPRNAIAIRCETPRSSQDVVDGWLLFAEKPGPMRPDAVGKLCLVSPKRGTPMVAFVNRGYKANTFNLIEGPYFGQGRSVENASVDWVAPVLWVRPQQ